MRKRIVGTGIAAGVVVLGTGGIVSAAVLSGNHGSRSATRASAVVWTSSPAWTASPTPAAPTAPPPVVKVSPTSSATAKAAARPPITYVVKPGDNLSVISAWFHLHGYGALYDANRAVIGANPNLIHPGLRITIAGGQLTMGR